MNFKELITNIIHICLILFILCIPFTNDTALLFLYSIAIPNILIHWKFNSNTCSISLIENIIGNALVENYENCISNIIIDPLYNLPEKIPNCMNIVYAISILLWLLVIYKLYLKYKTNEITHIYDLFRSNILL